MRRASLVAALALTAALIAWWGLRPGSERPGDPGHASADGDPSTPVAAAGSPDLEDAEIEHGVRADRARVTPAAADNGRGALHVVVHLLPALAPLPHVAIHIVARDGRDDRTTGRVAVTGDDGIARFDALGAGTWHVECDRGAEIGTTIRPDEITVVTFEIPAGVDAIVRVVDVVGASVPGSDVLLWPANGVLDIPTNEPGIVIGQTGVDGELRVDALPHLLGHGSWFAARHPQLGTSNARMVRSPTDANDTSPRLVELQLGAASGAFVDVRVVGSDGSPLPSAAVTAQPVGTPSSAAEGGLRVLQHMFHAATTNAAGRGSVGPLAKGDYLLRVHAHRHAPYREPIRVDGAAPISRDVRLESAARVHGVVTGRDGAPVADARVVVQLDRLGASATTGPDGRFTIDELETGTASWSARHEAHRFASGEIGLLAGDDVELRVTMSPLARLHGRVVDEEGAGLEGFGVTASADLPGYQDDIRTMLTDADGVFATFARDDIDYELSVLERGQGLPPPIPELTGVRPRDEPWVIRVPDDARATSFVEGFLVDRDGEPAIAGQHLSMQGETARRAWFGWTVEAPKTDPATGRFRIGPLPPGLYTLWFAGADRFEFPLPDVLLTPRSTTQLGRIELPATGTLAAAFELEPGFVPGDVLVQVESEGSTDILRVDRDSWTAAKPALPGSYLVTVYGDGFRSRRTTMEIVADETATFRATLCAGVRTGLRFHMPEGESGATFEVRDARGEPAFDVELEPGLHFEDWWPTLDRGTFGVYAIGASGRRYYAEFSVDSLDRSETPVELRVEPVR